MPASREERGLPKDKPKAVKSKAAQKRGNNGKGYAKALGMEHAYDKVYREGDELPCCGHTFGDPVIPTVEECDCRCHETARFLAKFKS